MDIRRYRPGEEIELWQLYFNTTHQIVAKEYTIDQVNRWAASDADMSVWTERLARKNPFVAVENDQIIGFAELEKDGHIDYFYCHHEWQRKGVGTLLLGVIEAEARDQGIDAIYAEVSTTAVDFFTSKGFEVTKERTNIVCEAPAKQYEMRKSI